MSAAVFPAELSTATGKYVYLYDQNTQSIRSVREGTLVTGTIGQNEIDPIFGNFNVGNWGQPPPLTPSGTVSVGGNTLYFYNDPLEGWCSAAERNCGCRRNCPRR